MSAKGIPLSGLDWQHWANQLLLQRYGTAEYQRVPDKDQGDAGLEGFTLTNGHAYQSYGVEEPVSTAVRYDKQRDKMTRDIGKFKRNKALLKRILGTVRISRWVLFVPKYDSKDLIAHASTKTQEVLHAQLPYVTDDFHVYVAQEDEFTTEADILICGGMTELHVTPVPPTSKQVADWLDENDHLLTRLDGKIGKLTTLNNDTDRKKFRDRMISHFIQGQNILEGLRQYPELYQRVCAIKTHRETFLETECMIASGTPGDVLQGATRSVVKEIKEKAKGVAPDMAEHLGYEAISDWLIRCPLDFPEGAEQ